MKFRLISEEATSEKPFIWKKGCDKTFVTAPFLGLFITHFIEIASYT